jgi:predicted Rossmann-fold nucleotide-binding protein
MESYLTPSHYDLVTPDGRITNIRSLDDKKRVATVEIKDISPAFVGYELESKCIAFNLKSTLAQLGINATLQEFQLENKFNRADLKVELVGLGTLGATMLSHITEGAYIGKLFAKDDRRKVRDPDYLMRMFGRSDRKGRPLLSLGGLEGSGSLILEKIEGRTVAFLSLLDGVVTYEPNIYGFLPTLAKALCKNISNTRQLIHLHQQWHKQVPRIVHPNEVLLVKTSPLHIRTVYAHIVDSLLPPAIRHTTANFLQPDTADSGDIYELYGTSPQIVDDIPLEFFTLEPHREHVFFADRDQLTASLEDSKSLFEAFATSPEPKDLLASVFVVKGTQMKNLKPKDWIVREPFKYDFPGLSHPARQAQVAEKYVEHQPAYPFLKAIEEGLITSEGILLTRHFPTPLLKRMLLNDQIQRCLKRIYFKYPSLSHDGFFSHEDRSMLVDLAKFGIPVFWVDDKILQYVLKPEKEAGLFVPLALVETFRKATFFGVYGSNLQEGNFEQELRLLLEGVLALKATLSHPLLCSDTPLALLTGGGPGAMEVGNRVAKSVGILSCANIVDFRSNAKTVVNEQRQNAHIDAKMTYRLDRLVERQAEFYLDIPIFLPGGIGMDFEYTLEEVRRKTGATPSTPILLFGDVEYWKKKVSSRFRLNRETGTTKGSEWVSNCFYCIQTAEQGLWVIRNYFENKLKVGKDGPIYEDGFCIVENLQK